MIRAVILALAVGACGTPIRAASHPPPDAASFNSCDPGSSDPSTGDCGGGGGMAACSGTCRHYWECHAGCDCDGIRCVVIPP